MGSDIGQLSNLENELVKAAHSTHGEVFENADRIASFFNEAFILKDRPKGWIFMLYLSQVRANLLLMLLSTIRNHDIQMLMMGRQMLEATTWTCYALSQQEFAMKSVGTAAKAVIEEMEKWDGKKYEWLDREFAAHSANLKKLKKKINDYYAHVGIYTAQNNLSVDVAGNIQMEFFDARDEKFIAGRLWLCADLTLSALNVIADAVEKYPGAIVLTDDFNARYKTFCDTTDRLLAEARAIRNQDNILPHDQKS